MTTPMPAPLTADWAANLEQRIDTLLADLDQFLDTAPDDLPDDAPEPPSGMPYDGCTTCQVREILAVAIPATVEAVMSSLSPETPPNGQE